MKKIGILFGMEDTFPQSIYRKSKPKKEKILLQKQFHKVVQNKEENMQ
jgi:hypothetical protein